MFSSYFQKIHALRLIGFIDDSVVRLATTEGQVDLYLAIEPLEAMRNAKYDDSSFEFFARLYGRKRVRESFLPAA
jgi:hypothetical protein